MIEQLEYQNGLSLLSQEQKDNLPVLAKLGCHDKNVKEPKPNKTDEKLFYSKLSEVVRSSGS